jgi:streptogramin lyase
MATPPVASKIGRITTAGMITEFPLPTVDGQPEGITTGPDGALWFVESARDKIGRVTTAGSITEFPVPTSGSGLRRIVAGSDGALWFTENVGNIGRITTVGVITEFPTPTRVGGPEGIAAGPDGALWFVEQYTNKIGRSTTNGTITEIPFPTGGRGPLSIAVGPDAAFWFTDYQANTIGRMSLPALQAAPPSGPSPLAVTFETWIERGDISGGYTMDFGDGMVTPLSIRPSGIACTVSILCYSGSGTISHIYVSDSTYWATLRNSFGTSVATVQIIVASFSQRTQNHPIGGYSWRRIGRLFGGAGR